MQGLAARLGESRIAQALLAAAVLGGLLVLAARYAPDRMELVSSAERARTAALFDRWLAASRAERCERPALREPTTGDGAGDYAILERSPHQSHHTAMPPCLSMVSRLRKELEDEHCKGLPCRVTPLLALRPHPEVLAQCADLFAAIERHAHTTRSCSPAVPEAEMFVLEPPFGLMFVARAVRLEIAPLVARGELGHAARHVTDAMRYAEDYTRNTPLSGVMVGRSQQWQLAATLDEILSDPRLRGDDARAIVRDLDVLGVSPPSLADVWRAEVIAVITYDDLIHRFDMTGDSEQDRALVVLAHERFMAAYDAACAGVSAQSCAARLRTIVLLYQVEPEPDYRPVLASSWDPDVVRERVVNQLADERLLLSRLDRKYADIHARLEQLRAKAAARAAQP